MFTSNDEEEIIMKPILTYSEDAACKHEDGITVFDYNTLSHEERYNLENDIVNIFGEPKVPTGSKRYGNKCKDNK